MTSTALQLDDAIAEWASLLGPEHVATDAISRRSVEVSTFRTAQRVPAILKPGSRFEVQGCLEIANRFGIPVYPISSGMNWGYGSRVPPSDGCVILDLRRMNQIVEFDEDAGYVVVEPGVTQRQLLAYLQARGSRLWIDATGASPDTSFIGNTMERGFGHTPYGDHFANVCGLEVVLPTGECVNTGFSRFPNATTSSTYKWGFGPSVDGLFSQSNLGIVTRMSLWLMPAPEYFQAYFFRCDESEQLPAVIDAIRPLRLNNTIRSAVHIGNDYKVLSSLQQYPWEETNGTFPLTPDQMASFRKKMKFGTWNGSGGLYGTKRQVAEARRLLKSALKGKVDKLQFLDDRMLNLAARFAKPFEIAAGWDLSRTLDLVKPVYGLLRGQPTAKPLESTYWRKRGPLPATSNPDRDGCGLLWCAPTAPIDGKHVEALTGLVISTLLNHCYEPMMSLTMITDRTLACVTTIAYDRDQPGEDEKAMACFQELIEKLAAHGYYSYRLGVQSMHQMSGDNGYNRMLRTIKNALDPNAILAPGRYEPRQ